MLHFLILIAGFFLLIWGASRMVNGASSLARSFRIPNIVIGLTIVAFGTSSPELVVNVIAAMEGNTSMVLGNVIGSNIFNVMVILGLSAALVPLAVQTSTTWIEIPLSLLAAVVVLVVSNDLILQSGPTNIISRSDGIIMLLFFSIFLAYNLSISLASNNEEYLDIRTMKKSLAILLIIAGIVAMVIGGRLIVNSASTLARNWGLSERIIALTIVSIGTSLPELATSIVAVRKKNVDMAIGNVVGSNIFNIFFILGISSTIGPVLVSSNAIIDVLMNVFISILLFAFIFTGPGRKLHRWEGISFLLLYIGYLSWLIMSQ